MKIIEINSSIYSQISNIYMEGIQTGNATFETKAPTWEKWDASHLSIGRIAWEENNQILGWAALSPVSTRDVYKGVAEISVYISTNSRGKGIGKKLLLKLIEISEQHSIWTLQSGIMRKNEISIQMHVNCGFRIIGYREKVGQLKSIWYDNIILERRSKIIGF